MDALCFLKDSGKIFHLHHLLVCVSQYQPKLVINHLSVSDLLRAQHIPRSVVVEAGGAKAPCCELVKEVCQTEEDCRMKKRMLNGQDPHQEDHLWLDHRVIENLPVAIKKGKEGQDLEI